MEGLQRRDAGPILDRQSEILPKKLDVQQTFIFERYSHLGRRGTALAPHVDLKSGIFGLSKAKNYIYETQGRTLGFTHDESAILQAQHLL
jgi:hypothetical protein